MLLLALLGLLPACGGSDEDRRFDADDAEAAGCGTWESAGQPVLLDACAACHAAALSGEARHGAPEGMNLDTLEGARTWAEAIEEAVTAGTMPPGGGLSQADAARLLAWLDCDAPGEEAALPVGTAPAGLLGAAETRVSAAEEDGELVLYTDLSGGDLDGRTGAWSAERYQIEGERAWLVGRTLYDAEGAEALDERWEPPLLILDGAAEAWLQDTTVTRTTPDAVMDEDQRWEATAEDATDVDPRVTDPDAPRYALTLSDAPSDGEGLRALSWRLSPTLALVERHLEAGDGEGGRWTESHLQLTVAFPFEDLPAFPLSEDVEWMGRMLLAAEASP